jgi:pimeloyl-ACP methyl ester carboxylesterase
MRRALALLTATITVSSLFVAPPAQAATSRIDWRPCPDAAGVECGTLRVPVDWSRPRGAAIDLALARRKATVPAERIGSVLINPGGPGGEGVAAIKESQGLSDEVARRFDIVGFDPRGVGLSNPVLCDQAIADEPFPASPASQAEFQQLVDHNRRYGDSCRRLSGPVFDFMDSVSVARDMDAIRAAVGDSKLTYYGVSYGTLLGQMYAELFPGRIRALVLDSNMDHSLSTALQFMRTEALGFQESFDEFVKWNARTASSPLAGQDARAVFRDLMARAERGELTLPDGTPISAEELRGNTFGLLYGPEWALLAGVYAFLQGGGTSAFALPGKTATKADPFQAVLCQDWRLPLHGFFELAAYRVLIERTVAPDVRLSPLGETGPLGCVGWPDRTTNPQHALRIRNAPPILMVNSRFDPATPYQWATNAASQSRDLVLLHYDGWGHGAYFKGSACVSGAVDTYLITRRTPPPGTHCPGVEPPAVGAQSNGPVAPPRW